MTDDSPVLGYASPPPTGPDPWVRPGAFARRLPPAPRRPRLTAVVGRLLVAVGLAGGVFAAVGLAWDAGDLQATADVRLAAVICWAAVGIVCWSATPLWALLRHGDGPLIVIDDGVLTVVDRTDRLGRLTVPVADIRDVGLCGAASAYGAHAVWVRVEHRSGGLAEARVWTGELSWVGAVEADVRAALQLSNGGEIRPG